MLNSKLVKLQPIQKTTGDSKQNISVSQMAHSIILMRTVNPSKLLSQYYLGPYNIFFHHVLRKKTQTVIPFFVVRSIFTT